MKRPRPNKPLAKLADRHEVATFHRELRRKLDLQRARRYRFLFYRKFTKELRRYASRYQDWFVHRVLGVGRDPRAAKQAATRQTTSIFR